MKRLLAALLLLAVAPASAAESRWIKEEGVTFRLVSREDGVGERSELLFGLQVRPERGFKFFWRAPGQYGLRPSVEFPDSANVASRELRWPTPRRLVLVRETGDSAIGYDRETVLPIRVRPERANAPLELKLVLEYGICGEFCTGGQVALALTLPATGPDQGKSTKLLEDHLTRVPASLAPGTARVQRAGDTLVVEIAGRTLLKPDLFVDAGPGRNYGPARVSLAADRRSAVFRLPLETTTPEAPASLDQVSLLLLDGNRAYETIALVDP